MRQNPATNTSSNNLFNKGTRNKANKNYGIYLNNNMQTRKLNRENSEHPNNIFNIKGEKKDQAVRLIDEYQGFNESSSSNEQNPIFNIFNDDFNADKQDDKIQDNWNDFGKENIDFNNFTNQINPRPQSKLSNNNKNQDKLINYSPLEINPKNEQKNTNTSSNDSDSSDSKTQKPKTKHRGELYKQMKMFGFSTIHEYFKFFSPKSKADIIKRIERQNKLYKKAIKENEKKLTELREETTDKRSNNVKTNITPKQKEHTKDIKNITADLIKKNDLVKRNLSEKYKKEGTLTHNGKFLFYWYGNRALPITSKANQKYIIKNWKYIDEQREKAQKALSLYRELQLKKTKEDNMLNERKNTENNNNTISNDKDKLTKSKNKSNEESYSPMVIYPTPNIAQLLFISLKEKIEIKSKEKEQNLNEEQKENIFKQTINNVLSSNLLDILIENNIDNAIKKTQQKEEKKEVKEEETEEVKEEEKIITNDETKTTAKGTTSNIHKKTLKRSKSIVNIVNTQTLERRTHKKKINNLEERKPQFDKSKRANTAKTKTIPNINQAMNNRYHNIKTSNNRDQYNSKNIIPQLITSRPKTASKVSNKKSIKEKIIPQLIIPKTGNDMASKVSKKEGIKEITTMPKLIANNGDKKFDDIVMDSLFNKYSVDDNSNKGENTKEQYENKINEMQIKQREKEILSQFLKKGETKLPNNDKKTKQEKIDREQMKKINEKYKDLKKQSEKVISAQLQKEKEKQKKEEKRKQQEEVNNQLPINKRYKQRKELLRQIYANKNQNQQVNNNNDNDNLNLSHVSGNDQSISDGRF